MAPLIIIVQTWRSSPNERAYTNTSSETTPLSDFGLKSYLAQTANAVYYQADKQLPEVLFPISSINPEM